MSIETPKGRWDADPECAAYDALLPLHALDKLDAQEAEAVRAHVATCAHCQARLAEYGALRQGLREQFGAPLSDAGQFAPFSLSAIIAAERLDRELNPDAGAPATGGTRITTVRDGRRAPARPASAWLGGRLGSASRELAAIAAVLLVALAASLLFFTLRPAASVTNVPRILEFSSTTAFGELDGIAPGPDGALWFANVETGQIGRMTPAGDVTLYNLPAQPVYPDNVAAGPDGALWFTEAGAIGRITTAGAISDYALPHAGSQPLGITLGPDGALWFTEMNVSQIGRITTAGAITEYPLPRADSLPSAITSAPDGALWFTEPGSSQIGRITTKGRVTEYLAPGVGQHGGITAGPDGNIWFTETGAIGRITPRGAITLFHFASPVIIPGGITSGPDGALWFTVYSETQPVNCDGHTVGRITTTGRITIYPLPTPNACGGAIISSHGALWFVEKGSGKIGEIKLEG
jgi:virginiamycin B lyase